MSERHCQHCGALQESSRSIQDHRRLFAIIDRAYENWPEAEFQPRDSKHLRAYLTVKAGHIDVYPVEVPPDYATNPKARELYRLAVESAAKAVARKFGYTELRVSAAGIEIIGPRSIDRATLPTQKEFNPIRDAICAQIEDALGIQSVEQLLRVRAA